MLLNFCVSNFLSFHEKVCFSLVPGRATKQHPTHILKGKIFNALKGAAVYGANASGKTNLINALMVLKNCVLKQTMKDVLNHRFKLYRDVEPTIFEIDFEAGAAYRYTLKTNGLEVFFEELLLLQKTRAPKLIFQRDHLNVILGTELEQSKDWYLNRTFQAQTTFFYKLIQDGILDRIENIAGAKHIKNVFLFFRKLVFLTPDVSLNPAGFGMFFEQNEFQDYLKQLLKVADLGISDIKWAPLSLEETERIFSLVQAEQTSPVPSDGTVFAKDGLGNIIMIDLNHGQKKGNVLKTIHNGIEFFIHEESAGTRRLLDYSLYFFLLKKHGGCLIIDELDCRLHLFLSRFLIDTHMNNDNIQGQLIVSLHDLNLMDQALWRTDEIWYTEKRVDGSSDLYSLYQFKPRFDIKLQNGYMQGKYGAVPMIGEFND